MAGRVRIFPGAPSVNATGVEGTKFGKSRLKQADFRKVRAQPVEMLEVRGEDAIASTGGRRHDNRVNDRCAFDGGDGLAGDSRQIWEQRLDDAGIEEGGKSSGAWATAPSFHDYGSRDGELMAEPLRQLDVS